MRTGSSPSVVDPIGCLRDSAITADVISRQSLSPWAGERSMGQPMDERTAFQRHRGLTRSWGLRG